MIQLKNKGIPVHLSTGASATHRTARLPDGDGRGCSGRYCLYAVGQSPLRDEALALGTCAGEFYMLGDCVSPGNIAAATGQAHQIALNIGRR